MLYRRTLCKYLVSHPLLGLQGQKSNKAARQIMSKASASRNAYINEDLVVKGKAAGPLSGLTFAVKDMYAVEGQVIGFGNPTWKSTHKPAKANAPAIQILLDAGATLRGRTHMDELAYSLNGENKHYGTPTNPACPDRIPGGSSSGSAVAVASGDVDFAVGSDTGGSIRVPASYCGIYGMRPSHDRISLDGACPLAPSFDTCGWFSRDAQILQRIGAVLLSKSKSQRAQFQQIIIAKDAFALGDRDAADKLLKAVSSSKSQLEEAFGVIREEDIGSKEAGISSFQKWFQAFRIVQAAEAWEALGEWITEAKPEFGPGTKERFEAASKTEPAVVAEMQEKRTKITDHMDKLMGNDTLLLVPAAPGPAPKLNTPPAELDSYRSRLISLTCIAGLAKLPQITLPCVTVNGCPVGLGIIGPRGSDEALLEAAVKISSLLRP